MIRFPSILAAPFSNRRFQFETHTAPKTEKSPNDIGFLLYLSGISFCLAASYLCLAAIVGVLQLN
ncbi:hypothetical protein, partial [uncultured Allobaculum sp.]